MAAVLTLFDLLRRAADLYPTSSIIFKDRGYDEEPDVLLYSELLRVALSNATRLRKTKVVEPGKPIILYFSNHRDNVIWYWSVVAAGGVPAVLCPLSNNPTTMAGELDNIGKLFNGHSVLTSKQLTKFFRPVPTLTTHTIQQVQISPEPDTKLAYPNAHYGSLATILFTSGSTGYSKAVEFTHLQLIYSAKTKFEYHGMNSTKSFMSWITFDHSVALCEFHLHALYAGSTQIMVPPLDFIRHPLKFWQALSDYKVAYTFSPNFFIGVSTRALKEHKEPVHYDFSHLRVLMCGGEANKTVNLVTAEEVLQRFGAPRNCIKPAYGLSETCSAIFYNRECPSYDVEQDYLFASIGKSIPFVETRIVDPRGYRVPWGETGSIQLSGIVVFHKYFNNEAATAACRTSDGWFDTGDLGYFDHNGNIVIVGRHKEVLIINGKNYSSFELEHAIENDAAQKLTVSFTASFSVWTEQNTDSEEIVVLFNPLDDDLADEGSIRTAIDAINETTTRFCSKKPYAVIPLPRECLPKTTIGKLSRAKLKEQFVSGRFDQYVLKEQQRMFTEEQISGMVSPLQIIIRDVLAQETGLAPGSLHLDIPITDLNIESLGYLRIKSGLENALEAEDPLSMPHLLACKTIRDIDLMLLSLGTTTPEYDPIVPLVTTGSKTPLILCHPGGGEFLTWLSILPYMKDRKILALRVKGFHKNEETFKTVDEMLDRYIIGIKQHQPEGPYALLGLCFGGMLSYELGKRLEAMGEQVAFIGGIDNPPELNRIQAREQTRNFIIDLLHFFQVLTEDEVKQLELEMKHIPDHEFTPALFARFPDGTLEALDLTVSRVEQWSRINDNMQNISREYIPTGTVSKYDMFWVPPLEVLNCTEEQWRHEPIYLAGWQKYVAGATSHDATIEGGDGPLRYHRIDGTHFTILRPDNVGIFQKYLNDALTARGI